MNPNCTDDRPWLGRDDHGAVFARAPWMPQPPNGNIGLLNVHSGDALRIPPEAARALRPIVDLEEYERELPAYTAWCAKNLPSILERRASADARRAAPVVASAVASVPVPRIAATSPVAEVDAEPLAPSRDPAADLESAIARHRGAERGSGDAVRMLRDDDGRERLLLFVAAAEDPSAPPHAFDVGADAVIAVPAGTLGSPVTASKGFTNAVSRFDAWQQRARTDEVARLRGEQVEAAFRDLGDCPSVIVTRHHDITAPEDVLTVDDVDVRMAIEWAHGRYQPTLKYLRNRHPNLREFAQALETLPEDERNFANELGRTLSARVAEKAARWFYRAELGADAHDVARVQGEQLKAQGFAGAGAWVTHDLAVEERGTPPRPVDVKNVRTRARRAADGEPRLAYREHCVPRFKEARTGEGVVVAGVESGFRTATQLIRCRYDDGRRPRFLGETTRARMDRLAKGFTCDVMEVVFTARPRKPIGHGDTPLPEGARFIPPWMYDYPPRFYGSRDQALARVRRTVEAYPELLGRVEGGLWPVFLAAGVLPADAPVVAAQGEPWSGFVRDLRENLARHGLSLPVVYLSVLRHFLETVTACPERVRDSGFDPEGYRDFLYVGRQFDHPLGIYDPLRTVSALIDSLCVLVHNDLRRLLSFRVFKFRQSGQLSARQSSTAREVTVMAPYCGGLRCGREELVLGDHTRPCGKCGFLICPSATCGHCGYQCRRGERRHARRLRWIETHGSPPRPAAPAAPRRPSYDPMDDDSDDLPF